MVTSSLREVAPPGACGRVASASTLAASSRACAGVRRARASRRANSTPTESAGGGSVGCPSYWSGGPAVSSNTGRTVARSRVSSVTTVTPANRIRLAVPRDVYLGPMLTGGGLDVTRFWRGRGNEPSRVRQSVMVDAQELVTLPHLPEEPGATA